MLSVIHWRGACLQCTTVARSSIAPASCVLSCGLSGQDEPSVPDRCLRLIAQTLHDWCLSLLSQEPLATLYVPRC